MKRFALTLFAALLAVAAVSAQDSAPADCDKCPDVYQPVCVVKDLGRPVNYNFRNRCEAECRGLKVESDGLCAHIECIVPMVWSPVCAEDGSTYSNHYEAACYAAKVVHPGSCTSEENPSFKPVEAAKVLADMVAHESTVDSVSGVDLAEQTTDDCFCTQEFRPVCGKNGVTYSNACHARCAHQPVAHLGPCQHVFRCICTREYNPVCGENGVTYSNECIARCRGVRKVAPGPCF